MKLMGIRKKARCALFDGLRQMTQAALPVLNGQDGDES